MQFRGKFIFTGLLLLAFAIPAIAQFSVERLKIRAGYSLYNPHAKRFNKLIDDFNNKRYLIETSSNMGSLNFMHGIMFGVDYKFTDEISVHAILKNKHQAIKALYIEPTWSRHFLFRSNTLELGLTYLFQEKGIFSHAAGAGVVMGGIGVFTDWSESEKRNKTNEMLNVSNGFVLGLSINYEVRIKVWKYVSVFVRPVMQYSLNSNISHLNDFFNPTETENGTVYAAETSDKLNNGALNGIGIEGGLLISLPKISH